MATTINGALPTKTVFEAGPILTMRDFVALQRAPKRPSVSPSTPAKPAGTRVTMWAKPVPEVGNGADHMWVEFDDGRRQFIARGGPNAHGLPLIASAAFNDLSVAGQVDPAQSSPDYGQGRRILDEGFLAGVSAEAATAGARRHMAGVNQGGNRYGWSRNSNSFASDVFQDLFGRRVGDERTAGCRSRLSEAPPEMSLEDRARSLPWIMGAPQY